MRRWMVLAVVAAFLLSCSSGGGESISEDQVSTDLGEDLTQGDIVSDGLPDGTGLDLVSDESSDQQEIPDALELQDGTEPLDLVDVTPGDQVNTTDSTDTTDTTDPEGPEVFFCGELPEVTGGSCDVTTGSNDLLLRGIVLGSDKVYVGGSVLVGASGSILCVGCDCGDEPEGAAATVVTCPDGIVSPAFINAHDHLTFTQNLPASWGDERFEHRHDWRKGIRDHSKISAAGGASTKQVTWGEMRNVVAGATSIAGSGTANGFLRNLDRTSQEGLNQGVVEYQTFPLGDSDGTLLSEGCAYPGIDNASVLDNDCYLPHVAEGIDRETRNEFLCLSSTENGGVDLTEANSVFIHGIGLKAIDGQELAANGTSIVWSPRTNISLYGNTAQVTMYHNQGVLVALGTDWTRTGSINMQRELACAAFLNDNYFGGFFSDYQLWQMATYNGAVALAVDDAVGSLQAGLVADIAIFDAHGSTEYYRAIIDSNPEDTLLVLRGGEPLYGDLDILPEIPGGNDGCEEIPGGVCGVDKAICAFRETGMTFSEIADGNTTAPGLFYCGVPDNEPSCVPFRLPMPSSYAFEATAYEGENTELDLDGDGIPNDQDNCPELFNPIRPVDNGVQGDHDQDGLGDVCDPCPMDADTEVCSVPDPMDKDGDGHPNTTDNCPSVYNPEQTDGDADAVGDACDACPEDPNPGNGACPASIYDIKQGIVAPGNEVEIVGVVTAVVNPAFFIQVPEADYTELGASFSGIYIYVPSSNSAGLTIPQMGDFVAVEGLVYNYYGQLELSNVTLVEVLATGQALPTPVTVEPADVGTAGVDKDRYESVLLRTEGTVTDLSPASGAGDGSPNNEYVLDGALRVNDLMYATTPFPSLGDYLHITGILRWANENSKIEPRDADDVVTELDLKGFSEASVIVLEGATSTYPELFLELTAPAGEGGVTVELLSSAPAVASVASSVVFPEGIASILIPVQGVLAQETPVTISATLDGTVVTSQVIVVPATTLPAPASLEPLEPTILLDGTSEMTVTLTLPAVTGGTTVNLSSEPAGVVGHPASVVVAQGEVSAVFAVSGLVEGDAVLTASAGGISLPVTVHVVSTPALGLVITEVLYDVTGDDNNLEWVEIYNGSGSSIDLSGYSLGSGGTSLVITQFQLSGIVGPGECIVVGGTASNGSNYNPVYFQAADFNPDIQNSGTDCDAVALFDKPTSQVTSDTVPVDAVLYGSSNGNNLKDESGGPGNVDVGDADANSSISRTQSGWVIQPAPTPNDCTHALMP